MVGFRADFGGALCCVTDHVFSRQLCNGACVVYQGDDCLFISTPRLYVIDSLASGQKAVYLRCGIDFATIVLGTSRWLTPRRRRLCLKSERGLYRNDRAKGHVSGTDQRHHALS